MWSLMLNEMDWCSLASLSVELDNSWKFYELHVTSANGSMSSLLGTANHDKITCVCCKCFLSESVWCANTHPERFE